MSSSGDTHPGAGRVARRGRLRLGRRASVAFGLLTLVALLLASCGFGAGPTPGAIELAVTREFGAIALGGHFRAPKVHGSETVMSLLMRNATVHTRYGGGFVQSIDGYAGGTLAGSPIDWFYYVNGVEAAKGAAETTVHRGDHIWWDLHNWSQTEDIPAVVGSFPEPFLNGIAGRRLPVRVECAEPSSQACKTVLARLRSAGVPAALAAIGPGDEPEELRILVGPWPTVRSTPATQSIERGPGASGVYARIDEAGHTLTLLDARGRVRRTLTAGAGLIAATRYATEAPVWVVTGTDSAGVALAARSFTQPALHDHFALAIEPSGANLALPLPAP